MQIKSGKSYFKETTTDGWVFRFPAKKARLWLGHALPVLIVLVDVDCKTGYWQQISSEYVTSTGKGFKVVVPRAQSLDRADAAWTHIASGIERCALDRFELAITQLPPSVRKILEEPAGAAHADAAVLALHLAEGRNNPRGTVRSLVATQPAWITRRAGAWAAIASYAAEHDELELSSKCFELLM
jgi:hypothetical protein